MSAGDPGMKTAAEPSRFTHLECAACAKRYPREKVLNVCDCGKSLYARYDLSRPVRPVDRPGLWRYAPLLPVLSEDHSLFLGEGWTPLLRAPFGRRWFIKEEGVNPTGFFKARGMAVAISKARELGIRSVCVPTAGNAGGACAAYTARGGLEAKVYLPEDAPAANLKEIAAAGGMESDTPPSLPQLPRPSRHRSEKCVLARGNLGPLKCRGPSHNLEQRLDRLRAPEGRKPPPYKPATERASPPRTTCRWLQELRSI